MKNHRSVLFVILILLACSRSAAADLEPREPLTSQQIEELVSPIALYPDPLVALILPASTRPSDIVLAARFLERGGDPDRAVTEPWDESVKALVRYPEVLTYLDENLGWTRSLGEHFLDQRDEVMDAIQMVRVRARAAGLLRDTREQEVIVESDEIRIVPASPTVIYVPHYDPAVLYVSSFPVYYAGPFISFGIGYRVGAWLNYDCDWRYRHVRIAHRPVHWYHQPDWHRRHSHHPTTWRQWAPSSRHDRRFDRHSHRSEVVLHPSRPRGLPDRTHPDTPANRHRDAHFVPERGRDEQNSHRNQRTSPRRDPSATRDARPAPDRPVIAHRPPPEYQRPPVPVSPQRAHNGFAGNLRQDHRHQPTVHSAPAHSSAPSRAVAPPTGRSQPAAEARPAESRNENHDRGSQRQRAEASGHRRQLN